MLKPLLGPCDSYQLEPFAYEWAWAMARQQEANTWSPEEVQVGPDVADYKNPKLDPRHKHLFESVMAQLTTFDILRGDEIAECLQPIFQPAEIKHFLKRMAWDEALHCYEEGTEILTSLGWRDFREVTTDSLVAQFTDAGTIEFVHPQEVVCDDFNGELIEFKNGAIHSSVTPNHRVISFMSTTGNKKVEPAETTILNNRLWPVAAQTGSIGELAAIDRLRIAFQADGCGQFNKAVFRFKKPRKIARLEKLLIEADIRYDKIVRASDPDVTEFRLEAHSLPMSKYLGEWVKLEQLTFSAARQFVKELIEWDGSRSGEVLRYWATHQQNIDTVQAIAALGGYHARVPKRTPGHPTQVTFVDTLYVTPETATRSKKPYKGKVYCVAVPSGVIVVRYKENVLISGNTRSYRYVIENLGIPLEIYTRYQTVPEFRARVDMCEEISHPLFDILKQVYDNQTDLHTLRTHQKQDILRSMIFYFLIFEGCWFWISLMGPIQQLSRLGVFRGAAEQFTYIARDEQQHVGFGIQLIREFIEQYPECLTKDFLELIYADVTRALDLEDGYIQHCLKDGPILGYSVPDHMATAKFFANLRLGSVGLAGPFPEAYHAFPWMSEAMELKKEKNFFESRVTEYQAGSALSFDTEHSEHEQPGWSDPLRNYELMP